MSKARKEPERNFQGLTIVLGSRSLGFCCRSWGLCHSGHTESWAKLVCKGVIIPSLESGREKLKWGVFYLCCSRETEKTSHLPSMALSHKILKIKYRMAQQPVRACGDHSVVPITSTDDWVPGKSHDSRPHGLSLRLHLDD